MRYLFASVAVILGAVPALALDLNSFRAQHGRPPLAMSSDLSGYASAHAQSMASRGKLDHAGYKQRRDAVTAENVAYGCPDQACAFRTWAKSGGHRANLLRGDVTAYGIGSATAANGQTYWVLALGN